MKPADKQDTGPTSGCELFVAALGCAPWSAEGLRDAARQRVN